MGPLGLEKNLITERIFAFFDQDRDGVISFTELVGGLSVLCKGNLDEKIECKFGLIILMKIIGLMFIIYNIKILNFIIIIIIRCIQGI